MPRRGQARGSRASKGCVRSRQARSSSCTASPCSRVPGSSRPRSCSSSRGRRYRWRDAVLRALGLSAVAALRERDRAGRTLPSLRRYARNRFLRIFPAYWAILAVSALVLHSVRLVPLSPDPLIGALHDPGLLLKDALLVQELSPTTLASGDRASLVAVRGGHVLPAAPPARAARRVGRKPGATRRHAPPPRSPRSRC